MTDQNDGPVDQDSDSWVIPIPNSESPAYAVMPWPLFQRLRALAKGRQTLSTIPPATDEAEAEPNGIRMEEAPPFEADLDRVIPLPMQATDDLWSKSMEEMPSFEREETEESSLPLDVLEQLLDGEHPLKFFRRHRALTQKQLTDLTGLNAPYLSQIETRKRRGSTRGYRRLATALGVDIGDLIE